MSSGKPKSIHYLFETPGERRLRIFVWLVMISAALAFAYMAGIIIYYHTGIDTSNYGSDWGKLSTTNTLLFIMIAQREATRPNSSGNSSPQEKS